MQNTQQTRQKQPMWRNVWTIARYDLLRSLIQRETFIFGLAMPALMMFMLGVAITDDQPTITLDVINEDGSPLSVQFVALLQEEMAANEGQDEAGFRLCPYHTGAPDDCNLASDLPDRPDAWRALGDERLEDTDTFGVIIIEAGFGENLRAGEPVSVIFKNSSELSAPTLASQKLDAAVSRLGGSVAVANLAVDVAADYFPLAEAGSESAAAEAGLDHATAFDEVKAMVEDAWSARPVRVADEGSRGGTAIGTGFQQSGPGTATMFVMIFMLNTATLLIHERERGTLQRLFTLPVSRSTILAGKILGQYLYGIAIFVVLVGVGALMGVEWSSNVPGIALIILVYTLACTALGMAMGTIVRTSDQANSMSTFVGLILSPLGGAWWPLEIVPEAMQTVGHISPVAWAMDSFSELMWYNGSLIDILPNLAVLLGMTALFFAFSVFNFKYE